MLFFLANMGGGGLSDPLPHYAGAYIRKNAGVRGTRKKLEESGKKIRRTDSRVVISSEKAN